MRLSSRKAIVGVVCLLGGGTLVVWWLRPSPVPVDVARVERGDVRVTLDEDGQVHIRRHTTVAAPISGRVLESDLRAGDSVHRGDVIATMIAAPLDPRARAQELAQLRAATALVAEARAQAEAARLALDEAHRARLRADELIEHGAIALREHEMAITAERTRQQGLDAAQERVRAAESDAAGARAALLDTRPEGSTGTARVSVRAPLSGHVLRVYEEHDRAVAAGTPLLDLGDLRNMEIIADVLSTDAASIHPGALMLVRANDTSAVIRARVTVIEPAAFRKLSPLGVEEQRVNVRATPLEPLRSFGDGYQVDVSIVLWQGTHVLKMPVSALVADKTGWSVFRLRGNRVQRRPVRVGHRGTQDAEILDGLSEGDRVVLYPSDRVGDGVRVCTGKSCP